MKTYEFTVTKPDGTQAVHLVKVNNPGPDFIAQQTKWMQARYPKAIITWKETT